MNNEQYVKAFLSQGSFFMINKSFIKELGLNEAALLALLIDRHNAIREKDGGWFYSVMDYIQAELNLGRKPIDTALAHLVEKHLVHTKRQGCPAKKFYFIDWTNIKQLMENIGLSSSTDTDDQDCPKRTNLIDPNGRINKKEENNKEIITPVLSNDNTSPKGTSTRFIKPKLEEVVSYCNEKGYVIDAAYFLDYYESKGWKVGKTPMKDWKAAIRTWIKNEKVFNPKGCNNGTATPTNNKPSAEHQRKRDYNFSF